MRQRQLGVPLFVMIVLCLICLSPVTAQADSDHTLHTVDNANTFTSPLPSSQVSWITRSLNYVTGILRTDSPVHAQSLSPQPPLAQTPTPPSWITRGFNYVASFFSQDISELKSRRMSLFQPTLKYEFDKCYPYTIAKQRILGRIQDFISQFEEDARLSVKGVIPKELQLSEDEKKNIVAIQHASMLESMKDLCGSDLFHFDLESVQAVFTPTVGYCLASVIVFVCICVIIRGRFIRLRSIGKGAEAEVYLCYDLWKMRHVALKETNPRMETLIPQSLGLVRIYEVFLCSDICDDMQDFGYILMEPLEQCKILCEDNLYLLIDHVITGLRDLHESSIFHGDIKPQNILMKHVDDRRYYLADFGCSGLMCDNKAIITSGTRGYMSPEVQVGIDSGVYMPVDAVKADIFALGRSIRQLALQSQLKDADWSQLKPLWRQMMHDDPNQRPSLAEIQEKLNEISDMF